LVEVGIYVYTYASVRPLYCHEIGSPTARRCVAPQPVLTRYKLLEIARPPMQVCHRSEDTKTSAYSSLSIIFMGVWIAKVHQQSIT
jgi:hypothetical protein